MIANRSLILHSKTKYTLLPWLCLRRKFAYAILLPLSRLQMCLPNLFRLQRSIFEIQRQAIHNIGFQGVMTAHWLSYIFFYCLSWKSPHPSVRGSKLCLIIWFVIAFMSFLQLFQFFNLYGVGEPRVTILLITYLFKSSLVLILPYIWWHHRSWGYWFNSHLG